MILYCFVVIVQNAFLLEARFYHIVSFVKTLFLQIFQFWAKDRIDSEKEVLVLTPAGNEVYNKIAMIQKNHPLRIEYISESCTLVQRNNNHNICHAVNVTKNKCECGNWEQLQVPCEHFLQVHGELKRKCILCLSGSYCNEHNIFNENFFGSELLTSNWKKFHDCRSIKFLTYPGCESIKRQAVTEKLLLVAIAIDSVSKSQKRIKGNGDLNQGSSISLNCHKAGFKFYLIKIEK